MRLHKIDIKSRCTEVWTKQKGKKQLFGNCAKSLIDVLLVHKSLIERWTKLISNLKFIINKVNKHIKATKDKSMHMNTSD